MNHAGYAWRKYDRCRPYYRWGGAKDEEKDAYVLWPAIDEGQHPQLNRWEKLEGAFAGFISRGLGPPIATAYSAKEAMSVIFNDVLHQAWTCPGGDVAEAYEYLQQNILGVWMGEKTPFLLTPTDNFLDIVQTNYWESL